MIYWGVFLEKRSKKIAQPTGIIELIQKTGWKWCRAWEPNPFLKGEQIFISDDVPHAPFNLSDKKCFWVVVHSYGDDQDELIPTTDLDYILEYIKISKLDWH